MKERNEPDPHAWFNEHEKELSEKYPGEWIALDGTGWLAHSPSTEELAQLLDEEGRDDVFVIGIDEAGESAPFYIFAAAA